MASDRYVECSDENAEATQMATMLKARGSLPRVARLAVLFVVVCAMSAAVWPQSTVITITLAGQSMIRSDMRETVPTAVPGVQGLLKGGGMLTNLEGAGPE